jgi:transcriptional regulator with XRE-family HTH domain
VIQQVEIGDYSDFAERLVIERRRLGLGSAKMAAACSVTANVQTDYEHGRRLPKGDYLMKACQLGVDGLFLLTGKRSLPISSDAEDEGFDRLVALWAELPEPIRLSVVHLVETIAGQKGERG